MAFSTLTNKSKTKQWNKIPPKAMDWISTLYSHEKYNILWLIVFPEKVKERRKKPQRAVTYFQSCWEPCRGRAAHLFPIPHVSFHPRSHLHLTKDHNMSPHIRNTLHSTPMTDSILTLQVIQHIVLHGVIIGDQVINLLKRRQHSNIFSKQNLVCQY